MHRTVDEIGASEAPERPAQCPNIDHSRTYWVNMLTGQRHAARCRRLACEYCANLEALKKARIISHAGGVPPQRYAVLTQFPLDWQKGRQKMRDFPRLIGRRGFEGWSHAWTVEVNPRGTGLHVNVLQKGPYVPQEVLQEVWGSIVHIKAIRGRTAGSVAAYGLKEARTVAGYSVKDARSNIAQHLAVNGKRLVHVQRGYLEGKTQAQVWAEIKPDREPGWVLVTP